MARASRTCPVARSTSDKPSGTGACSTGSTVHYPDVDTPPVELIERYFRAMRTGAITSVEIIDLFADEAVYVEPFSGAPTIHVGKDAIRQSFRESQVNAPPDMTLTLDQVDVESDCIRSVWTCASPAFPRPMRGQDLWSIRDGKIHRLETSFLPNPDSNSRLQMNSDDSQR